MTVLFFDIWSAAVKSLPDWGKKCATWSPDMCDKLMQRMLAESYVTTMTLQMKFLSTSQLLDIIRIDKNNLLAAIEARREQLSLEQSS